MGLQRILSLGYVGAYHVLVGAGLAHWPLFGSTMMMRRSAWEAVRDEVHRRDAGLHDDMDLAVHLGDLVLGQPGRIVWRRDVVTAISARPFARAADSGSAARAPSGRSRCTDGTACRSSAGGAATRSRSARGCGRRIGRGTPGEIRPSGTLTRFDGCGRPLGSTTRAAETGAPRRRGHHVAIFRSREGDATADAAQAVATQANQWGDPFGRLATRSIQIIVVVVVVAGLIYAFKTLSLVTIPVLLALIFASAMHPVVSWLRHHRVPSLLATLSPAVGILGVLGPARLAHRRRGREPGVVAPVVRASKGTGSCRTSSRRCRSRSPTSRSRTSATPS